jgi:hypothetical protein
VIDAEPALVTALAAKLGATPNRFGGFASVHPHWKVDFWSLPNTWASAVGLVRTDTLADLVDTTFFDCDAICYEVQKRKITHYPAISNGWPSAPSTSTCSPTRRLTAIFCGLPGASCSGTLGPVKAARIHRARVK